MSAEIRAGKVYVELATKGASNVRRTLQTDIGGIFRGLKGLFAGLIPAIGMAGMVMAVRRIAATADNIGKGAKRISVTTDEYQRLSAMAKNAGADVGALEFAFKAMSQVIVTAADGSKTAVSALGAIGLTVKDLAGLAPEKQFEVIAEAISKIPDPTERAGRANAILGRGAQQLMPLILAWRDLRDEVESTQQLMDAGAIAAAEKFNDTLRQLGENIQAGLLNSGLIVWLENVTGGLAEVLKAANQVSTALGAVSQLAKFMDNIAESGLGQYAPGAAGWRAARQMTGAGGSIDQEFGGADMSVAEAQAAKAERIERRRRLDETRAAAAAEAEAESIRKQGAAIDDMVVGLGHKLSIQRLINDGWEREATIAQAVADAQRSAGRDLSDAEWSSVAQAAGEVYDATVAGDVQAIVDKMQQQLDLQRMINDGMEREAAIAQAIAEARQAAGGDLEGSDRDRIEAIAGALFDARAGVADSSARLQTAGSFTADARMFGGDAAADRTAKATEEVSRNTRRTVQLLQSGGAKFT